MLGDALSKWTSRVVDLRSRAMEVQAHYDQKLLRSLFVKWTDQCIQHGDDLSLVESFRDVKEEGQSLNSSNNRIFAISHRVATELHRKVFRHWLYATRKNLELSRKLERKLAEDNRATLEALWEKWRDRFGESALLEQELAVVERRNTGSKRRVLNSLINRSLVRRTPFVETRFLISVADLTGDPIRHCPHSATSLCDLARSSTEASPRLASNGMGYPQDSRFVVSLLLTALRTDA